MIDKRPIKMREGLKYSPSLDATKTRSDPVVYEHIGLGCNGDSSRETVSTLLSTSILRNATF